MTNKQKLMMLMRAKVNNWKLQKNAIAYVLNYHSHFLSILQNYSVYSVLASFFYKQPTCQSLFNTRHQYWRLSSNIVCNKPAAGCMLRHSPSSCPITPRHYDQSSVALNHQSLALCLHIQIIKAKAWSVVAVPFYSHVIRFSCRFDSPKVVS